MRNLRLASATAALLALPLAARAQEPAVDRLAEVSACIERNIPRVSSEQVVEFIAVDRIGGERVSRAKIIAKRFDDGLRRLRMRFSKPTDMRGSALLMIETESGANDMFLYSPELRKVKRVSHHFTSHFSEARVAVDNG